MKRVLVMQGTGFFCSHLVCTHGAIEHCWKVNLEVYVYNLLIPEYDPIYDFFLYLGVLRRLPNRARKHITKHDGVKN